MIPSHEDILKKLGFTPKGLLPPSKVQTAIPKPVLTQSMPSHESILQKIGGQPPVYSGNQISITPPLQMGMQSSTQQTLIGQKSPATQALNIAKSTIQKGPETLLNLETGLAQGILRSGAAVGNVGVNVTNKILGTNIQPFKPETPIQQGVFGTQPIPDIIGRPEKGFVKGIAAPTGAAILAGFDVSPFGAEFKGFKDITTKVLSKLVGRKTVSKQFISDLTNSPDLKQPERDLIRNLLSSEGNTVSVPDFANKVKSELLPLKTGDNSQLLGGRGMPGKYENINLPDELRGPVADYKERIYESPIKTSAGGVHFRDETYPNYFAHSRVEDLPDTQTIKKLTSASNKPLTDAEFEALKTAEKGGSTRRVIELQSDLFQKGRLEGEANRNDTEILRTLGLEREYDDLASNARNLTDAQKARWDEIDKQRASFRTDRENELTKLEPYRNTWHERVIREEVKQAAKDGKTKLQFPTGETAMKIEGLVNRSDKWVTLDNELVDGTNIKKGDLITYQTHEGGVHPDRRFLVTKNNGDGTFEAVDSLTAENDSEFYQLIKDRNQLDDGRMPTLEELSNVGALDNEAMRYLNKYSEQLSAKDTVDTNNPIYKFYEKEVGRYLTNKYGATQVTDPQGVKWYELDLKGKGFEKAPVEAFGAGAGIQKDEEGNVKFDPTAAALGVAGLGLLGRAKRVLPALSKIPTQGQTPQAPRGLREILSSAKPSTQGRSLSTARKFVTGGERILRESGPSGIKMAQAMDAQRTAQDLLTGRYTVRISKALAGLSKEERLAVTDSLEGAQPVSEKVAKATTELRTWLDEVAAKAEADKFEMKTGGGGTVPFKKRDDYFPRQYDFDALAKGKKREEALQYLVATKQAPNLAKAEELLQNMINNAQRRAGNLENPRMADLPGYERDPSVALPRYAQSVAKRFTEADFFGKKDEKIAELIKSITNEKGDYKEAQRIFDFTVDGMPKNKIVSAITQFNVATKLSLSAIVNATQTINTATKFGILNTAKGIWGGFTKEGKELAELVNAYDDFIIVKETGVQPARIVRGVMYIFKKVENFNRRTAANTGYLSQAQLVNTLRKNPESGYAIRQLESLGVSIQKALQGKLTDDDILGAANKAIQKTQFKVDPFDVPPSWKTPLGRLITQFKSFSFMQTKFVRDEIIKEARHGNLVPLVTFVTLAVPASLLVAAVRNKLTGREEGNIDIRQWDKWMKAFGTIPTDLLIQGKFLKDTMENDMMTPLQKSARVAGTVAGPTADEAGKLIAGVENIRITEDKNKEYLRRQGKEEDPYKQLKRQAVEKIPFVGQYLKNTYLGYPKSTKTLEEKEANAVKYDIIEKALRKDYNDEDTKKEVAEYIKNLPSDEARKDQLFIMRENGVNVEGISSSNFKTELNLDEAVRTKAEKLYQKVESFNPSKGWTKAEKAARDSWIEANLNEETKNKLEEYKEWLSGKKASNTKQVRDLLYPDPKEAVTFYRSLPDDEKQRIFNLLTEEEKAQLIKGK